MLVKDGKILATGRQLPCPEAALANDLEGAVLLPAFSDAHTHFLQTGITALSFDLTDYSTPADLLEFISANLLSKKLFLAYNLSSSFFSPPKNPPITKFHLDKISTKHFIWLTFDNMHAAILNEAAIKWATSILKRDDFHIEGKVTGKDYMQIANNLHDYLPKSFLQNALKTVEKTCFSKGVAYVHAMEGSSFSNMTSKIVGEFFKKSKLKGSIYNQSPDPSFPIKMGWKQMGGCILADGAIGSRDAALNSPYEDTKENAPLMLCADEIKNIIKAASKAGLQLALHSIGDKTNDVVSSLYNWTAQTHNTGISNRIEHFILPSNKAIRNVISSKAFISIQPSFDYFWGGSDGLYAQRLGKTRERACNPFKTLLNMGISLAGGSDSPVTPIDPVLGIHAMLNHHNSDEQVDLNSALNVFITEPHKILPSPLADTELKEGADATFTLFDIDPFLVSSSLFKDIEVKALYIGGEKVY